VVEARRTADLHRDLLHQIRHLPDRDEAARLAMLMISYQKARWQMGAVELSRDAPSAQLSGCSKSMRTSRLLLRSHHLGTFALPSPPDKGRRVHESAREIRPAEPRDTSPLGANT